MTGREEANGGGTSSPWSPTALSLWLRPGDSRALSHLDESRQTAEWASL
jgi:hypothetical protein